MGTPSDVGRVLPGHARRLYRLVAVGLFGLLLIIVGIAVDMVLHAQDPDLAAEEGLLSVQNPGHLLLGLGIAATIAGLTGTASVLIGSGESVPGGLRIGRLMPRVGLLVLVLALVYVGFGPGFGHGYGDVADAVRLADGSRLSSGSAAAVDRSRLPPDEAMALTALAWSRSGSLDPRLEHDHDEDDRERAELSALERETLAAQLAVASQMVAGYDTLAEAEAAGYVQASTGVDGVGAHWVKWSLVDRPFDPSVPSMLLFEEVRYGRGPELVAFSYWVASRDEPEGFAGATDVWHQHFGLCFEAGWLTTEDIPDRGECAGDWINGSDLWMLHAWLVPGLDNRLGQFAAVNPKLCERVCG